MIRTSGAGVVRRYFDVTSSSFNYPVGTSSVFTPFNLAFTNGCHLVHHQALGGFGYQFQQCNRFYHGHL
jgi:hypothetical protein